MQPPGMTLGALPSNLRQKVVYTA